jgi:hypothetical protein
MALSKFTGFNGEPFLCVRVFDPTQVVWKAFYKTPMDLTHAGSRCRLIAQIALIDPSLDGDMGLRLLLKVPLF